MSPQDAVDRVCLTVEAGKSLEHTKELSFGPEGLWGCGLEWNVTVLPEPDAPNDEMTIDLAIRVKFGRPADRSSSSNAPLEPLTLLKDGRGKQFFGRYEPGHGVEDGTVAEHICFEIGNAFSWFRAKRLEIFLELLRPGAGPACVPALPPMPLSARPSRHQRPVAAAASVVDVAAEAAAVSVDADGTSSSSSSPVLPPADGPIAAAAAGDTLQPKMPFRRAPLPPQLSLLSGARVVESEEPLSGICALGQSPPRNFGQGPRGRFAVGVLAQLRLDARRLCEEIEPKRAALDELRLEVGRRERELADLERSLDPLMRRIADAEADTYVHKADDNASPAAYGEEPSGADRDIADPVGLFYEDDDAAAADNVPAEEPAAPEATKPAAPFVCHLEGSNSGMLKDASTEDFEDIMDVIGKARCRRCGRQLPLDPEAMERHAEECEAEEEGRTAAAAAAAGGVSE